MNSKEKIEEFKNFTKGWNGYDADTIDTSIIDKAIYLDSLIPFDTFVAPTAANSIQFEFEKDNYYLEIEIKKDSLNIFEESNGNENEKVLEFGTKGIIEVLNYIKLFHKEKIENIAVFSGAFNPPTKAHYHVMKKIIEKTSCDLVSVALGNENFLSKKASKTKSSFYYSEEDRLFMMLKMTALNKDIIIYGIEDGCTFDILNNTKNRFKTLENKLGNTEIYFVAGSDKIDEMKIWRHSKELLSKFSFIILTRKDKEIAEEKCKKIYKNYALIDTSVYEDISSTKVRDYIKNGKDISSLVTKEVEDAINLLKLKV